MRILVAIAFVLAVAAPVAAEDVAAVLAAMPDIPAEQRYLALLCERIGEGIAGYGRVVDEATACIDNPECPDRKLFEKEDSIPVAERILRQIESDYQLAGSIFQAKRDQAPAVCRHHKAEGIAPITASAQRLAAAKQRRFNPDLVQRRTDCLAACAKLSGGPDCTRSCEQ